MSITEIRTKALVNAAFYYAQKEAEMRMNETSPRRTYKSDAEYFNDMHMMFLSVLVENDLLSNAVFRIMFRFSYIT